MLWEVFAGLQRGAYRFGVTIDNLFDETWNEAQFATTSRLHHEPSEVTELNYTPGAPRSIQIGLTRQF